MSRFIKGAHVRVNSPGDAADGRVGVVDKRVLDTYMVLIRVEGSGAVHRWPYAEKELETP